MRPTPAIDDPAPRTLRVDGEVVRTIDQSRLPFERVELVLRDDAGERRIARGVSQYSAVDIRRIARRHSREIEGILGYTYGENVVHRDDLVLL